MPVLYALIEATLPLATWNAPVAIAPANAEVPATALAAAVTAIDALLLIVSVTGPTPVTVIVGEPKIIV